MYFTEILLTLCFVAQFLVKCE